jgi:hypothetical protein
MSHAHPHHDAPGTHRRPAVRTIDGGLGALAVHTDAAPLHDEIETSPADPDGRHRHEDVLERVRGARPLLAAVSGHLPGGLRPLRHGGVVQRCGVEIAAVSIAGAA